MEKDPGLRKALALPDLVGISAVNSDSPASDPTVFHKRYLKKIRDLGEVRAGLGSGVRGSEWLGWGLEIWRESRWGLGGGLGGWRFGMEPGGLGCV